jgi:hypothetical protein
MTSVSALTDDEVKRRSKRSTISENLDRTVVVDAAKSEPQVLAGEGVTKASGLTLLSDEEVEAGSKRSKSRDGLFGMMAQKPEPQFLAGQAVPRAESIRPTTIGNSSGNTVPVGRIPPSARNDRTTSKINHSASSDSVQKTVVTQRLVEPKRSAQGTSTARARPDDPSFARPGAQPSRPGSRRVNTEANKGANNISDSCSSAGSVGAAYSQIQNQRRRMPATTRRTTTSSAPTSKASGKGPTPHVSRTSPLTGSATKDFSNTHNNRRNQRMKNHKVSALNGSANSVNSFDILDVVRERQTNLVPPGVEPATEAFINTHTDSKDQSMKHEKTAALATSKHSTDSFDFIDVAGERQKGLGKARPAARAFSTTHNKRRNQGMKNKKDYDNTGSTRSTDSFDVMDVVRERQTNLGPQEPGPTTGSTKTYFGHEAEAATAAAVAENEYPRNASATTTPEAITDETRTRTWDSETTAIHSSENVHGASENFSIVSQFIDDDVSINSNEENPPLLEATLVPDSLAFDQQPSIVFMAEPVPAESSRDGRGGRMYYFYFGIAALCVVLLVSSLGIVCGTGLCSSMADSGTPASTNSPTYLRSEPTFPFPPTNLDETDSPTTAPSLQEGLPGNIFEQQTTAPTNKTNVTGSPTDPPSTLSSSGPAAASTAPSFNGTGPASTSQSIIPSGTDFPPSSSPILPSSINNTDSFSNATGTFLPEFTAKAMSNATSPQTQGWAWLQGHQDIDDMPEWRQLQLMALATLYFATGGESWGPSLRRWLNYSLNECFWSDFPCYGARYTRLDMFSAGLDGTIPAEISFLTNLEHLNFDGNSLHSSIPTEIGLLTALNACILSGNYLTGTIPSELGQLVQLRDLYIMSNSYLTGSLPTELGLLTASTLLLLDNLNLDAGSGLPSELGNLKQLTRLSLVGNGLAKSIPTELGMLTGLTSLTMRTNEFTGSIFPEIGRLTLLNELKLHDNALTSQIPTQIGQLTGLRQLFLSDNELLGPLPTELAKLTQLERLNIYSNPALTGSFPSSLCDLTTWNNDPGEGGAIQIQCSLIACPCGELCACL